MPGGGGFTLPTAPEISAGSVVRDVKNIRCRRPQKRTGLLRSGSDGSVKVGRCPFGALSRPFPSSAPDRIRQPSRLILAESHHHRITVASPRSVSPAPPDGYGPSAVYREKEIPNTWGPRRAVRPIPRTPVRCGRVDPFRNTVFSFSSRSRRNAPREPGIGRMAPAGPPRAGLPGVREPGKGSLLAPCPGLRGLLPALAAGQDWAVIE